MGRPWRQKRLLSTRAVEEVRSGIYTPDSLVCRLGQRSPTVLEARTISMDEGGDEGMVSG